jgi:hypothetical protein
MTQSPEFYSPHQLPIVRSCRIAAGAVLILAACGCGSRGRPEAANSRSSPAATRGATPANDYTKPYLTDEKMQNFLTSMKEDKNPFEVIFKKGGGMRNPMEIQARMDEFNTFARKYGFQDYQDYTAVWGRITVAQMQSFAKDAMKEASAMTEKSIQDAEEQLSKPDLNPETRKIYESQIESGRKSLAQLDKPAANQLNEADLALVQKYKMQLDEAQKKYRGA